jgi:uncharacterized protein (DUF2236 family)
VITPIILPWPLQSSLEAMARVLLEPGDRSQIDFSRPVGEAALLSPESVSWRVFKNPLSLFIGGVTAVIMELAEPRVRAGVWEHTTFRLDPIRRLRRTGLAAMVTIYGARSTAEPMIARIRRMHEMIAGTTASGEAYRANDSELLNWVHGTAAYGFLQAYHMYVQPLSSSERDRYYAEGVPAASLYGATGAPTSEVELEMLFHAMAGRLERSDIVIDDLGPQRTQLASLGSRGYPAGRSFRRPPRRGIQPSRSGLWADAPSGRLLVCPPQRSRVSTGPFQ